MSRRTKVLLASASVIAGAVLGIFVLGGKQAQTPSNLPLNSPSIESALDIKPAVPGKAPPSKSSNEQAAGESQIPDVEGQPAATAVTTQPPPDEPPVAARPAISTERILLLAPASPLIIELQLSIDGQPHTAALEKLVAEVSKLADDDADGRTTWKELCASKRVKYGQFGNLAIENENGEKQVIERYDIDKDGIVDATELPRFLTRNAGGSRPFSVRGTLDHQGSNRRGAATWRVLDADDDGVLSAADLAQAPARLASRDSDDDEILVASDLDPRLQTPEPEMMNGQRRRRGGDAIRLLGSFADWSSVQLALEQAYGGSHYLRRDSFPLTQELFPTLDKNSDGRLQRAEFAGLNDVPPHLVIGVAFGESGVPPLGLIRVASELGASDQAVSMQSGRLSLLLGSATLTIYLNDTVANQDYVARAGGFITSFDANKNGYLEKEEVPDAVQAQLGRFEAVDSDEDGKIYLADIVAYQVQQQAGLRAQIHARANDREDALFAALDGDHDERLDSREIEGTAVRLTQLDTNRDGQLTPDELPEVLLLGLARGSLENADTTFRPPPVVVRGVDEEAPRWFTAMDANQDGAISRREFLGATETFSELDANKNGLLELGEASKE